MKVFPFFILFALLFTNCNNCEDIACFTPPEFFRFQFVDKETGEDLLLNEIITFDDISVTDEKDNSVVNFSKVVNEDFYYLELNDIGWETEKVTYRIQSMDLLDFTFYVDAENISEDCCNFTRMNEVQVYDAQYERRQDGLFKILVQR